MSTENRFNPETTGTGEAFDLEERLAELEKQGIVARSTEPRSSLRDEQDGEQDNEEE